jgi:nucleoside-diphosphate-sugar epimerase
MNALTREMYAGLASALNEAAGDFSVRAVVISSEGDHFTAGNDIKDFLYIDDFTDGLLKATAANINGPINIASGKPATIKDVINALIEVTNSSDLKINYDLGMPSMIPVRLISAELANKTLNWESQYSLEDGLRKTYEWYLDFYQDITPESKK